MSRRILAVAAAAVTLLALAPAADAAPRQKEPMLVVTMTPAQVRLIPGETIAISLQTNRTTGYSWSAKTSGTKGAIRVSKGVYEAPENTGMVGVPGRTTWTVTAVKNGTGIVEIFATPPGGGDPGDPEVVTVIVKKC